MPRSGDGTGGVCLAGYRPPWITRAWSRCSDGRSDAFEVLSSEQVETLLKLGEVRPGGRGPSPRSRDPSAGPARIDVQEQQRLDVLPRRRQDLRGDPVRLLEGRDLAVHHGPEPVRPHRW